MMEKILITVMKIVPILHFYPLCQCLQMEMLKKHKLRYIFRLKPIEFGQSAGRGYIKEKNIVLIFLPFCMLSSNNNMYRTRAIITRGLYLFYPIFHCGLYSRAVYTAERLVITWFFFHLVSTKNRTFVFFCFMIVCQTQNFQTYLT